MIPENLNWKSFTRASPNIEYFVAIYFSLYGLSSADFLRLMPIFVFVESYIYQVDEQIESAQKISTKKALVEIEKFSVGLVQFLKEQKIYTIQVRKEIENLARYFALETQIISGNLDSFNEAIILRSSDFRLLHHILLHQTGLKYQKNIFRSLSFFELLVETEEDILQFKDDKKKNNFNSIAILKKKYPQMSFQDILRFLIKIEQRFLVSLDLLQPSQKMKFRKVFRAYRKMVPRISLKPIF